MNPLQGPATTTQQAPVRCHNSTEATVVLQPVDWTVISWRAVPVDANCEAKLDGQRLAVDRAATVAGGEVGAGLGRLVVVGARVVVVVDDETVVGAAEVVGRVGGEREAGTAE